MDAAAGPESVGSASARDERRLVVGREAYYDLLELLRKAVHGGRSTGSAGAVNSYMNAYIAVKTAVTLVTERSKFDYDHGITTLFRESAPPRSSEIGPRAHAMLSQKKSSSLSDDDERPRR